MSLIWPRVHRPSHHSHSIVREGLLRFRYAPKRDCSQPTVDWRARESTERKDVNPSLINWQVCVPSAPVLVIIKKGLQRGESERVQRDNLSELIDEKGIYTLGISFGSVYWSDTRECILFGEQWLD